MKVKDVMTRELFTTTREGTLESAARAMKDKNVGMLAVVSPEGRLVGTITDRDITVRAVARGVEPGRATVEEAMTKGCETCSEDDSLEQVARKMADARLRRMIVMSKDKKEPTGVVSLGDLAVNAGSRKIVGEVLSQVTGR